MRARRADGVAAVEGAVSAATSTYGLANGTVLGWARIGARTVVYAVDSRTSIWCTDAEPRPGETGDIGVIQWGEGATPHLRVAHRDSLNSDLEGMEAEQTVACGMALWRHAFAGRDLPQGRGLQPGPAVAARQGSGVSRAGR
ncbi:hypothetical protein [Glycomyces sp. NPDC047010]|uniref:hypothetical protein n=1 Tax=Glycomyces sp. NPDC047010 TaxID=3155023 RepID=UPI003404835E